jgi:hypothetical protein
MFLCDGKRPCYNYTQSKCFLLSSVELIYVMQFLNNKSSFECLSPPDRKITYCSENCIGIIINWLTSYLPRKLKLGYSSSVLYEFVLRVFQILPLLGLFERDIQYIP